MILAIAAAFALPVEAWAAAGDPPSSSRPASARARNPVDRSSSDPGAATFMSFDVDQDGYISRDEAKESSELTRRFNALDKNRDGKLSLRELTEWRNASYPAGSSSTTKSSRSGLGGGTKGH